MGDSVLMLGISGCRGIVGESLTPVVVSQFAGAFGACLHASDEHGKASGKDRPVVVVGRDGRAGGEAIARAAMASLCSCGCDVVDIGIAMTPTVGVMVDALEAAGGMVITASHNPQPWNGLKCLVRQVEHAGDPGVAACAPDAETAAAIIERYEAIKARSLNPWQRWDGQGSIKTMHDGPRLHVQRVLSRFDQEVLAAIAAMKPTVVLDSVNGAGAVAGRMLLEHMGCRVVHLGNDTTGIFSHTPEPTRENLTGEGGICQTVVEQGAIVGFAQDPDADRLALIDEKGRYIGEEYTLVLAASEVFAMGTHHLERASRSTAVNLSTSRMIDDVAQGFGIEVVRTPVGEANVVAAMKANDMVIGGEGNGGVIWSSVTYVRDSLGAMALVLASMARENRQLSAMVGRIPGYAIVKRKVPIASRDEAARAGQRVCQWAAAHNGKVDKQDGVRVDFDDGARIGSEYGQGACWVHVRASNTEPIMRLIAEAPTETDARTLLNAVEHAIAGE